MQDAIAMGEMVPGTIMIVTQFLGFTAVTLVTSSAVGMILLAVGLTG